MSSLSRPARACVAAAIAAGVLSISPARSLPPTIPPSAPAVPSGISTGYAGSECVVWDARTGAWYVTNNRGRSISKLVPGGEPQVIVEGLSSPQGMVIFEEKFIVADGANVRIIDMADPTQRQSIAVGGSNDLDVDPATGDIYVGSLSGNSIKRIRDGVVEPFATIPSPDGVSFDNGAVYANTLGLVNAASGLFRFDVETAQRTTIATVPFAAFDGLVKDGDSWIMTDFARGQVYRVAADGSLSVIFQLAPGTADPGFDPATRTLAVPNLLAGVVVFLTI